MLPDRCFFRALSRIEELYATGPLFFRALSRIEELYATGPLFFSGVESHRGAICYRTVVFFER